MAGDGVKMDGYGNGSYIIPPNEAESTATMRDGIRGLPHATAKTGGLTAHPRYGAGMENRRDFLKKAAALAGAGAVPAVIQRALAIEPAKGSTFYDAEHVVILMQENRSFDHCYGSLRGVRGFNDPRAVTLPNGNPVWLQSNAAGQTWMPLRLDLKNSSVTWQGCLPHDWPDQ